jgi:hypothetical protein
VSSSDVPRGQRPQPTGGAHDCGRYGTHDCGKGDADAEGEKGLCTRPDMIGLLGGVISLQATVVTAAFSKLTR